MGQHFLCSQEMARRIVDAASITGQDIVLEIGPGMGALTEHLCQRAFRVVAVEKDRRLYRNLKSRLKRANLELVCGDAFRRSAEFDLLVSSLPYSQSRRAVEWLAQQRFSRAILAVQREFAEKLVATGRSRRAVSVIASWAFCIKIVGDIPKNSFKPPPEVDSVVLQLTQCNRVPSDFIAAINKLFSQRRKTLDGVLRSLDPANERNRRLEELSNEEIVRIARESC